MLHTLKIHRNYYEELVAGNKTFELRWNDRNFQKGDILEFYDTETLVVHKQKFEILSVFSSLPCLGLKEGWVILSLKLI
ncbi:MAG: DUF3850 domain-containing protein [Candidatus Peregrinibacteria bacterium]